MAVCSVCGVLLIESDKHSKCLLHRKCSRVKPCKLDAGMPPAYWDEVELTLKANARKSKRSSAPSTVSKKPESPPPVRRVDIGGGVFPLLSAVVPEEMWVRWLPWLIRLLRKVWVKK